MRQTFGVPVEEIVRGIKHGVRKINIDTDCRLAMTAEFRRVATKKQGRIRSAQIPEAGDGCDARSLRAAFEQFGTAGQAGKIKVLPMSAMAKRYASGSLDPRAQLQRSAAE